MQIQPYLFFDGRCEEALDFYRRALGAEVKMLMRFKDAPEQSMAPAGGGDKIMHATFQIGDATVMASDGECHGQPTFSGFSLSLTAPSEAEAKRMFGALSEGGQVRLPITKTFFSPAFGMLADRFGVGWMVIVQ